MLIEFAKKGDLEGVKKALINENINLTRDETEEASALHWAVWYGHNEVVKYLLENGADVEAKHRSATNANSTPLLWAAAVGNSIATKLLLEYGANIHAKNDAGLTPFSAAKKNNKTQVAQLVCPRLIEYTRNGDLEGVKKALENEDINLTRDETEKASALHWAVWNNHSAIVKYLLEQGAYTETKSKNKSISENLIYHAGKMWNLCKAPIKSEPRLWNPSTPLRSSTVLHWAVTAGNLEAVELLLKYGADIHAKDNFDETPLTLAEKNKREEIIILIRKYASSSNKKDHFLKIYQAIGKNDELILRYTKQLEERSKLFRKWKSMLNDAKANIDDANKLQVNNLYSFLCNEMLPILNQLDQLLMSNREVKIYLVKAKEYMFENNECLKIIESFNIHYQQLQDKFDELGDKVSSQCDKIKTHIENIKKIAEREKCREEATNYYQATNWAMWLYSAIDPSALVNKVGNALIVPTADWVENTLGIPYAGTIARATVEGTSFIVDPVYYMVEKGVSYSLHKVIKDSDQTNPVLEACFMLGSDFAAHSTATQASNLVSYTLQPDKPKQEEIDENNKNTQEVSSLEEINCIATAMKERHTQDYAKNHMSHIEVLTTEIEIKVKDQTIPLRLFKNTRTGELLVAYKEKGSDKFLITEINSLRNNSNTIFHGFHSHKKVTTKVNKILDEWKTAPPQLHKNPVKTKSINDLNSIVSPYETFRLSKASYKDHPEKYLKKHLPDHEVISEHTIGKKRLLGNKLDGYKMILVKNKKTGELIEVFEGTNFWNINHLCTFLKTVVKDPKAVHEATKIHNHWTEKYGTINASIGHSMGGEFATRCNKSDNKMYRITLNGVKNKKNSNNINLALSEDPMTQTVYGKSQFFINKSLYPHLGKRDSTVIGTGGHGVSDFKEYMTEDKQWKNLI